MRETKFRVFDKSIPHDESKEQLRNPSGLMINWEYCLQSNYFINALNGVYPIMQYTGLKDKNGVDIFEGDVIANSIIKFEVKWIDLQFWCIRDGSEKTLAELSWVILEKYSVIGNIHQNPELLTI